MNAIAQIKHPPHNIDAEQALLGAILINNEAMGAVSSIVRAEDFYEPIHQKIFDVAAGVIKAGKIANPLTLRTYLPADLEMRGEHGDTVSLQAYVAHLCAEATTIINAPDYAQNVRDLSDIRLANSIGTELAMAEPAAPDDVVNDALQQLDELISSRHRTSAPVVTMQQSVARAVDEIAHAYARNGAISGITWGLRDLDTKTLGLQRGELIILAGRPGMGKTALGLCLARSAGEAGHSVLFASLEMGDVSLSQRALSDACFDTHAITYYKMRSGKFHEKEFQDITRAAEMLAKLPVTIDQRPGLTVGQISAKARQMKRRGGLDLVIVDHMHLVKASDRYAGNRVSEVGEISSALKGLAKDLGVAVCALCQLSRQVEGRDDKRPSMSDLRWSGEIEQDADLIVMLYREAYYLANQEPAAGSHEYGEWQHAMAKAVNKLEANIVKARSGATGRVDLFCSIENNAVRDLSGDLERASL